MRANLRVVSVRRQGPELDVLAPTTERDLIRDRVARRCPRLDLMEPAALDLAAELLAELHREFRGDASAVGAHRPGKYVERALRGDEHPLTLEDLCLWLVRYPARMRGAITLAARRAGMDTTIDRALAPTLEEAMARVAETNGELVAAVSRAKADGVIDDREVAGIGTVLRAQKKRIAEIEAAVEVEHRRKGGRK